MAEAQAKSGDSVKVHYTGKLDDDTVFDSSVGKEPLQFTIGQGQLIQGFEDAVVGMKPGESRSTKIQADNAYGPHIKELVMIVDRDKFPKEANIKVGEHLQIPQKDGGGPIHVMVTDITNEGVTLDANHPLAGKDLTFEIELMEIL